MNGKKTCEKCQFMISRQIKINWSILKINTQKSDDKSISVSKWIDNLFIPRIYFDISTLRLYIRCYISIVRCYISAIRCYITIIQFLITITWFFITIVRCYISAIWYCITLFYNVTPLSWFRLLSFYVTFFIICGRELKKWGRRRGRKIIFKDSRCYWLVMENPRP